MVVENLKEILTAFWYFFLICLLAYLIIAMVFNLFKSMRDEKEKEELIQKLIEEALKNNKK